MTRALVILVLFQATLGPARAAAPDVNNDGQTDVLWQNLSNGLRGFWPMRGTDLGGDLVTFANVAGEWEIAAMADFNADGQTDLLWHNPKTGVIGFWLMNGPVQQGAFITLTGLMISYRVAGVGDFNGDGKPDIVWQPGPTITGSRLVWYMNNTTQIGSTVLPPAETEGNAISSDWVISLVADFNGDGKPDLLWSNTQTGLRGFWLMNGLSQLSGFITLATVPTEWVPTQAGDFNGDGKTDIVWTNTTTGERGFWLLNGTVQLGDFVRLPTIPTAWRLGNVAHPGLAKPVLTAIPSSRPVALGSNYSLSVTAAASQGVLSYQWYRFGVAIPGATNSTLNFSSFSAANTGFHYVVVMLNGLTSATSFPTELSLTSGSSDFNYDGNSDILWQNLNNGQRGFWPMSGTVPTDNSFVSFTTVQGDWVIAGVADFDGDGKMDLLWRNRLTGLVGLWLMDGAVQRGGFRTLGIRTVDWIVGGVGDFNNDGNTDIAWQNTSTGQAQVWWILDLYPNYFYAQDLPSLPANCVISLVADFNGDGMPDLLLTNTQTGQRDFSLKTGFNQFGPLINLATVPTDCELSQTGDFNRDNSADIVWTNTTTGQRGIWLLNGVVPASNYISLPTISTDWKLGPVK